MARGLGERSYPRTIVSYLAFAALLRSGTVTRQELGDLLGVNPGAFTELFGNWEAQGWLVAGPVQGWRRRGQPPVAYSLTPTGVEAAWRSMAELAQIQAYAAGQVASPFLSQ